MSQSMSSYYANPTNHRKHGNSASDPCVLDILLFLQGLPPERVEIQEVQKVTIRIAITPVNMGF